MTTTFSTGALAFSFVAPAIALLPLTTPHGAQRLSPTEVACLQARTDPGLGSLRAGRVDAPIAFEACERVALATAQSGSPMLAELRGGIAPTDREWTWIAVGAGVVLLLVLL